MKNIITHPTIEEKKSKAIEVLKLLDIYKPYIDGFKQEDKVCFFEQFGGFWVTQEPEIEKKMHEIEQKHNCKVYAITHEFTDFGDYGIFLSLPTIPKNGKIWFIRTAINTHYTLL